jgi:hypothetical protein
LGYSEIGKYLQFPIQNAPLLQREDKMSESYVLPAAQVPRWLVWVGSIAIVFHLGAIGVNTLAASSGPWAENDGRMVPPPLLASKVNQALATDYLKPIRMDRNYHAEANRSLFTPGVWLEFRLKDEQGEQIAVVKLPDEDANPMVRHRQSLLTLPFTEDTFRTPPQSEVIAAPGKEVPRELIWEEVGSGKLALKTININEIPRNRQVSGPSDWMILFARSYARQLCREYGAATVELIRHHQNQVPPVVLDMEQVPQAMFQEVTSNFGEFPR